jgi:hypothetical protein
VPGAGQVLVEVQAAGVNPLDARIRSGELKLFSRHRMPLVLVLIAGPDTTWSALLPTIRIAPTTPRPTGSSSEDRAVRMER